ncbi:MAG: tyrosine-type recombinase/integrase [Motilibacteraceae bacterium]
MSDVDRLLAACSDSRAAQTRAYVVLACYAGLRVHEVAKVRGEDVMGDVLRVQGKGGSDATVPMHPAIAALARSMPETGWWFPSPSRSGPVSRVSVGQAIARAMKRAGVSGTPHACRHFYGTQVLSASGGNLRVAQRAMRHADVRSTAIYTQVVDDDLRRAVAGIPA